MKLALPVVALLIAPGTMASAQGVFDMGALTNTLSQDTGTQSEETRGHKPRKAQSHAQRKVRHQAPRNEIERDCADMPMYRAKLGAQDPLIVQLTEYCRQQGYGRLAGAGR